MVEIRKTTSPPIKTHTQFTSASTPLRECLKSDPNASRYDPVAVYSLFSKNGWNVQWIFHYGSTP